MKQLRLLNHEIWKFCCVWFDLRNEEYCPKCGKKFKTE